MDEWGFLAILLLYGAVELPLAHGEIRTIVKDGITYQETTRIVRRPVSSTHYEQRVHTVYRQQLNTEMRDSCRNFRIPVTEYQWVPRLQGRWNPFIRPYFTHDLVPVTRWEQRTEVVQVPVTRRNWIPEKRIVQVPVTTHRMAEDEIVSRIAIHANPSTLVQRNGVGGVARLDNDPPRQSTGAGWHAAKKSVVR